MILIRLIFFTQLLVLLPALALFVGTPNSLGTLYLLLLLAPVVAASCGYALWQGWRHRSRRLWALAIVATGGGVLATPFVMRARQLEPVPGPALAAIALALVALGLLALMTSRRRWNTGRLFAATRFNRWLLIALVSALLLLWLPAFGWLAARGISEATAKVLDDSLRVAALTYFPVVSTPALALMAFSLLYAPVGLVRNPAARLLHAGQLITTLLLMGSLAMVLIGLGIAMLNPG